MFDATTVANTILYKAFQEGKDITPLQLQKILYFISSHYAKISNKRVINEDFETWTYGPVLPSVYQEFKVYGANPIKSYAQDSKGKSTIVNLQDNKTFESVLNAVYGVTVGKPGVFLSQITHKDGSAWSLADKTKSPTLNWQDIKNDTSYYEDFPALGISLGTNKNGK